jgi:hypothetical protein
LVAHAIFAAVARHRRRAQLHRGQVSVFIDWQPAMGLPETVFGGLRHELVSMVYTEDNDLYVRALMIE